jgi:hypothetical protein
LRMLVGQVVSYGTPALRNGRPCGSRLAGTGLAGHGHWKAGGVSRERAEELGTPSQRQSQKTGLGIVGMP